MFHVILMDSSFTEYTDKDCTTVTYGYFGKTNDVKGD